MENTTNKQKEVLDLVFFNTVKEMIIGRTNLKLFIND